MYNVLDIAKLIINYGNTLGYGITYRKLCYLMFIISIMFNEIIRELDEKNLFKDKIKYKNNLPEIKAVKKIWSEIEGELPIEARFDDAVIKEDHAEPIYYSIKRFSKYSEDDLADVAMNMAITYGYVKAPIEEVKEAEEEIEQTAEVLTEKIVIEDENSKVSIAEEENVEVIVEPEKPITVDEKEVTPTETAEPENQETEEVQNEKQEIEEAQENKEENNDDFRGKVVAKRSKKHRKKNKKRGRK